jgi:hypothetical protein
VRAVRSVLCGSTELGPRWSRRRARDDCVARKPRPIDEYREAVLMGQAAEQLEKALTPTERLVAAAMSSFMDFDTLGNAYPGPALIARRTGLGLSTVKKALASLVDDGWLEVEHIGGSRKDGTREATVFRGALPTRLRDGRVRAADPSTTEPRPVYDVTPTRLPAGHHPLSDPLSEHGCINGWFHPFGSNEAEPCPTCRAAS